MNVVENAKPRKTPAAIRLISSRREQHHRGDEAEQIDLGRRVRHKIALLGASRPEREARDREACARADPNRAGRRVRPQNRRSQQFEPLSPSNRKKTNPVPRAITPRRALAVGVVLG